MEHSYVYILQSRITNKYYIGSTNNIERRVAEHNSGKVFSTKPGRPWVLKRYVLCKDTKQAKRSEHKLKKYKRRDIIERLITDGIFPWEYK